MGYWLDDLTSLDIQPASISEFIGVHNKIDGGTLNTMIVVEGNWIGESRVQTLDKALCVSPQANILREW